MATKPHKSLTGSDLHEPKGIEIAAPGQVYVSDGAGSGSWQTIDVQSSWSTGDVKLTYKTAADSGWIMMGDTSSIGDTGSGASFAGGGYNSLFITLWTNIPSSANLIQPSRGGSAAADWAAGKTCLLPKSLGRALAIAGAGSGLTLRQLGTIVGEEVHALTATENGPHTHNVQGATGVSNQSLNHNHSIFGVVDPGAGQPGGQPGLPISITSAATSFTDLTSHTHNFNVTSGSSGTGAGHNNMQPTTFMNAMIKV